MIRAAVVVCALALVAGSFGASAAPVPKHLMPKDEPLLFPTKVGARHVSIWNGRDLVEEVSKVTPVEGGFEVETETVSDDGTRKHCQTVVASKRGVLWTHYEGKKLDPACWAVKLPHAEGNSWQANWGGQVRTLTTTGWEEIEVPAGKFRAIRVTHDESGKGNPDSSMWYAPEIGCVTWYCTNSKVGRPLKSFTPGK
jgi:hypothetical protein